MSNQTEIYDVDELDLIYLSYDEPQKEEFWLRLKDQAPWAKRVDGVKGSDNAHKAAAEISTTERFILVDGDNIVDSSLFDQQLVIPPEKADTQFRWRSTNYINGLCYGNGGVSSWTRKHVMNMRTHENSDGNDTTSIEFCFGLNYAPMYNCYSTTYTNYTPKQAFRAGFREGVKMCSREGKLNRTKDSFTKWVRGKNLQTLTVWQSIGRDVENGFWSILGARLGTHYLMLRDWDYHEVQDFACLDRIWELHKNDDEQVANQVRLDLNSSLGTNILEVDSDMSAFFKENIQGVWKNRNIMLTEVDSYK